MQRGVPAVVRLVDCDLRAGEQQNDDTVAQLQKLSARFDFGKSLRLRKPRVGDDYSLRPKASQQDSQGPVVKYRFGQLPEQHGVPYVTATLEINAKRFGASATAKRRSSRVPPTLVAANWA